MKKTIFTLLCFVAVSQLSFAQTKTERNKAIYREYNRLANEKTLTDYSKFYAESFELKGLGKGPKAAEDYRNAILKTFPDLQVRIIELIAEGDFIMARCEATGTHKGDLYGTPATGKTMKIPHWTINRFDEEGKIVESWNLNNDLSMMRQLGILK